jgi:hypothetical protein
MSKQSDLVNVSQGADGDPLYVDTTNNGVGIGTSSLSTNTIINELHVDAPYTNGLSRLRLSSSVESMEASVALSGYLGDDSLIFSIGSSGDGSATERMRLDRFGQLLINTTDAAPRNFLNGTYGTKIYQGQPEFAVSSMYINRSTGTDGSIVVFRSNSGTVGSIQSYAGNLLIDSAGGLITMNDSIRPLADNTHDVGQPSQRWDDVYATNGTIQTSDANEKQQIASLTDAEMQAAKAISALFKTFKWNDSVAEKGEAARTHSGVIAQEVEQAMADAGLDAGDYAFFISTTWWETQTEVPAVEADEENGVEAQEAYTRTDTYETAEEAPEGAVERNRKGIRYPQLLAFVGAATEQRLASIEARLDALETS